MPVMPNHASEGTASPARGGGPLTRTGDCLGCVRQVVQERITVWRWSVRAGPTRVDGAPSG